MPFETDNRPVTGGPGPAEGAAPRVLLIEPHRHLARVLGRGLEEEGYLVTVAHAGADAELRAAAGAFDVFLLDARLPDGDGLSLLQRWRARGLATPVLVLTAFPAWDAPGPPPGADDQLPLPLALEELFARVKALTRLTPRPAG